VLEQHGHVLGQDLIFYARGSMVDNSKITVLLPELKTRNGDTMLIIGFRAALAAKSIVPMGLAIPSLLG
jgi:hypothetical protein